MSGVEDELEQKGKQEVDSELGGLSSVRKEEGDTGDQQKGGGSNQAQDESAGDQAQGNS
jgi:hypothetical protein